MVSNTKKRQYAMSQRKRQGRPAGSRLQRVAAMVAAVAVLLTAGALRAAAQGEPELPYSSERPLRVGFDEDYAPLQYRDRMGNCSGMDVDFVKEVMKRAGLPYTFVSGEWHGIRQQLYDGDLDLVMMNYYEDMPTDVYASSTVVTLRYGVVYRNDTGTEYDLRNLRGKTVAFHASQTIRDMLLSQGVNIVYVDDVKKELARLSKGEYDALIYFYELEAYAIRQMDVDNLTARELSLPPRDYCLVSHDRNLIRLLNAQISEMRRTGDLDRIYEDLQDEQKRTIPTWVWYLTLALVAVIVAVSESYVHIRRKLRRTDLRYKRLFDSTTEALYMFDDKGFLTDLNETGMGQTRFQTKEEAARARVNVYTDAFLAPLTDRSHPRAFQGDTRLRREDSDLFGAAGQGRKQDLFDFVHVEIAPIVDNGDFEGYVLSLFDISDLVYTQKSLKIEMQRAQQADRLKSAFLANVSHEIRTPLNAIVGFSDVLLNGADTEEDKTVCSKMIKTNSNILLTLINDILDLSKIESGNVEFNLQPTDMSIFFPTICDSLRSLVKPGVEYMVENPYRKCMVKIDQKHMQQILNNFISNAAKHTDHGHVRVAYRIDDDSNLVISIEDTGHGIPKEKQKAIFERFVKLDSFVQGTGLGLPIVKAIVEKTGGKIDVDSEPGVGSTFTVTMPVETMLIEKSS